MVNYDPYIKLYSAIVISFTCGIHWAFNILNDDENDSKLLIVSIIVALIAWVINIFGLGRIGFATEAVLFVYLLFVDFKLRYYSSIDYPSWFFNLRLIASIVVILSLSYLTYYQNPINLPQ